MPNHRPPQKRAAVFVIRGVRYTTGPTTVHRGDIEISSGRFANLSLNSLNAVRPSSDTVEIDLNGFLIMPGFINAHDHLQYALHPRLGNPPYNNYVEWGEDIHATLNKSIAFYKAVPRDVRFWWGGIRNLLSGVTTVCHHDMLWPALLQDDYPLKVVQKYGWSHSLALDSCLRDAHSHAATIDPFIVHACEGTDELARHEIFELDRCGILDARAVIVHGLALGEAGVALMRQRQASLILCLSSNQFLFEQFPNVSLLSEIRHIALGNDSPLTAAGDLLDEVRFAIEHGHVTSDRAFRMVTDIPATILRLTSGEGQIRKSGTADLIAIRDTDDPPEITLQTLSWRDVEFVLVAGQVQLASEAVCRLLPEQVKEGLEPLWIEGEIRWLRAPMKELIRAAEAALGTEMVRLNGRAVKCLEPSYIRRSTEPDHITLPVENIE